MARHCYTGKLIVVFAPTPAADGAVESDAPTPRDGSATTAAVSGVRRHYSAVVIDVATRAVEVGREDAG